MLCLNKDDCMVQQYQITLKPYPRGFHIITRDILDPVGALPDKGLLHVFIQHTSAALTINENADPDVRADMESWIDRAVKENEPYYIHNTEGPDDMPAHIKSSMMGSSVSIPITGGKLSLGTWQGIFLCEFRNRGGSRNLVVTVIS
jgi:secondary thiamine-phosphate synthase enzyme